MSKPVEEEEIELILKHIKSITVGGEYQAIIIPPIKEEWEE